jgi:hypothetical protein
MLLVETIQEMNAMDIQELRKIEDNIHWDMTPQSYNEGINGVSVNTKEEMDIIKSILKDRAGYFFFINVSNMTPRLCIMYNDENGTGKVFDIDVEINDEMLYDAIDKQDGAINISGMYAIDRTIRDHLKSKI